MSRDQIDAILAFLEEKVEFLIVGAHALAVHSVPRATGDLDIFIRATPENADRVWRALAKFGAPLRDVTREDFASPDVVFQIGVPPARIDVITQISGVEFDEAWPNRVVVPIGGHPVAFLGRDDLIRNKRAAARLKDLADVESLERLSAASSSAPRSRPARRRPSRRSPSGRSSG